MSRIALPAVAAVLIGILARAADEGPKVGLQPNDLLPGPFMSLNATGERADKVHCLFCRHGLNPVAAVFVRPTDEDNPAVAALLKGLEGAVAKHADVRLGAFAIFLQGAAAEERTPLIAKLKGLGEEKMLKSVVLAAAAATTPEGYDVPKDNLVTVVLYYRHRVKFRFEFTKDKPLTEADVTAILEAVDKLIPPRTQPARPTAGPERAVSSAGRSVVAA